VLTTRLAAARFANDRIIKEDQIERSERAGWLDERLGLNA
jgi:hypothetical protein